MAVKTEAVQGTVETVTRVVVLRGIAPAMFDRYAGDNETKLEPWQKLYLDPAGTRVVGLPSLNIMSFLSSENTTSAPKRLLDARKYKKTANACLSFVSVAPEFIPFKRDGKPIEFGKLDGDLDAKSGVYVHRCVARLKDGIPNPKVRPVLPLPWELEFDLTIYPNQELQETQIVKMLKDGGLALGIGTFRGVFGKFLVERWEPKEI